MVMGREVSRHVHEQHLAAVHGSCLMAWASASAQQSTSDAVCNMAYASSRGAQQVYRMREGRGEVQAAARLTCRSTVAPPSAPWTPAKLPTTSNTCVASHPANSARPMGGPQRGEEVLPQVGLGIRLECCSSVLLFRFVSATPCRGVIDARRNVAPGNPAMCCVLWPSHPKDGTPRFEGSELTVPWHSLDSFGSE